MKKILAIITSVFLFASCDIIEAPYTEGNEVVELPDIPRRVLLEEFTGYRCANCPPAADFMKELKAANPGRVELLTVHWGGFANPLGTYENEKDLRSETSQQVHDLIGVNSYPRIAVSRREFNGQRAVSAGKMEESMLELLFTSTDEDAEVLLADMDIETEATLSGNTLTVLSDILYVATSQEDHHIVHYIIQDSIVAAQLDTRQKPDNLVVNYVHTNTLVGNVNGFFGEPLSATILSRGDTLSLTHSTNIGSENWDREKLMILSLITDGAGGEVLQLYKTKVVVE